MCGIAGFFNQKFNSSTSTILQQMLSSQAHRGPDAEGLWFENVNERQTALGHRRLSIIDTSEKANQPMSYEHLVIVFNGEVYNYLNIRAELQNHGYSFDTESDTEVILKAFHKWQVAAISKFRGMFSFCIFDRQKKSAFLFRDRAGTKPLYYYHDANTFLFSSEIRSLRHHPHFKSTLCEQGLSLYFQYGYIPAPFSIFAATKKIKPGHYIEYDSIKNTYSEHKYWDLASYYQLPKLQISEHEATEQLETLLSESFLLRMISDVPVGVLLSGGIDSSLITAILQTRLKKPLDTFTMGFHHQAFDESIYAKNIAHYLGTTHHEQICTWQDAMSVIPTLPQIYDEPFADSSAIPTTLISKFAKQKVKVLLSGDGGDEIFCGYTSYILNAKRFEMINKMPFKKSFAKVIARLPESIHGYHLNYDLYSRYLKFKSILNLHHIEDKYTAIMRVFTHYDLNQLLINQHKSTTIATDIFQELDARERMMLIDYNVYLADDLLVKVDRATMYNSVEGREPLLDHHILEFAAQLPIHFKLKKSILKKILNNYLPSTYFERKKQGFGVPINQWLKNELSYLIDHYLDPIKLKQQNLLNPRYVQNLCRAFKKSKTNDHRVWTILMFQMWYEDYFK